MSNDVHWAFEEQKKLNFMRGIPRDVEVGGRTGFIFTSKTGRPMTPNALNNVLYNIVNAYNMTYRKERELAHFHPISQRGNP